MGVRDLANVLRRDPRAVFGNRLLPHIGADLGIGDASQLSGLSLGRWNGTHGSQLMHDFSRLHEPIRVPFAAPPPFPAVVLKRGVCLPIQSAITNRQQRGSHLGEGL